MINSRFQRVISALMRAIKYHDSSAIRTLTTMQIIKTVDTDASNGGSRPCYSTTQTKTLRFFISIVRCPSAVYFSYFYWVLHSPATAVLTVALSVFLSPVLFVFQETIT